MQQLDAIDTQILTLLQSNAGISNAELAKQLSMAPSGVLERVRKLEKKGVIEGYHTQINPLAVDQKLLAFIFIKSSAPPGSTELSYHIARIPGIQEVHHIAGEDCYLVKVRTADAQSLVKMMREQLGPLPGILSTKTTIVLETIKESHEIIIPQDQ